MFSTALWVEFDGAEKVLIIIAGNEDDDDGDDAENDVFQIPDAVFGSAGFQTANVAADGELIVPLFSPLLSVCCNEVMKQIWQTDSIVMGMIALLCYLVSYE